MPVSGVWNTGRELCPARSARLTGATGLGLSNDCCAIPSFSGQTCRPQCAQVVLQCPVVHAVSPGVAQHIVGNILHEIFYVVLADM